MNLKLLLFLLLAPLSVRELITICVPYKDAQWLQIEGNESMDKVFDFAYLEIIARGLNPKEVMFSVRPHTTEGFLKAHRLSERLLESL
jgi:hypothetical protein